MANPGFSAPDLTPEQIQKAREGKQSWPVNRNINFDVESETETDPPSSRA